MKREDERQYGARGSAGAKSWALLSGRTFQPELTLDVRNHPAPEIAAAIGSVLPGAHRRGVKRVLIAVSASGAAADPSHEARAQATIDALTLGPSAPLVRAFASAHDALGGAAALAVLLI